MRSIFKICLACDTNGMTLQELARRLWPQYLQPVAQGAAALSEGAKLMRALAPALKQAEEGSAAPAFSAAPASARCGATAAATAICSTCSPWHRAR